MKQFSKTKSTGKLGVLYVANVIYKTGSIFREIQEDTDVGIDGYIEFVENEIATGILVGVQIKAGSSYLVQYPDAKYFTVRASIKDMNYWNSQPIPVALIAYDPKSDLSGWIDITGYIRKNPECLVHKQTKITIHSTASPFTDNTFDGEFKRVFTSYRQEADLLKYANMMVSNDSEIKIKGFLGLMRHPTSRFSELTCFLLLSHLFHKNQTIRAQVTDSLSRYLSHPEAGFSPPAKIQEFVIASLNNFGTGEISQLLETAWFDEENLMRRGSIGQSVGVIITTIPNFQTHLFDIAQNPDSSHKARWGVMALAMEFGLTGVITQLATSFHKIDWGDVHEAAEWILEEYEQGVSDYKDVMSKAFDLKDFDMPDLFFVLREASPQFLVEYEDFIYQVADNTNDISIKFEAQHALHKIIAWRQSLGDNTS